MSFQILSVNLAIESEKCFQFISIVRLVDSLNELEISSKDFHSDSSNFWISFGEDIRYSSLELN
jgi:hypothetical protein